MTSDVSGSTRDEGGLSETEVDPARPRLSGSKALEVPDGVFDTPHRPRISWNLARCGG